MIGFSRVYKKIIRNLITNVLKTSSIIMNEENPDEIRCGLENECYVNPWYDGLHNMGLTLSWKASNSSASQVISWCVRIPTIHYRRHDIQSLDSVLSQMNAVHHFTSQFYKPILIFSYHLHLVVTSGFVRSGTRFTVSLLSVLHFPLFDLTVAEIFGGEFQSSNFVPLATFFVLGSNILRSILNTLKSLFLPPREIPFESSVQTRGKTSRKSISLPCANDAPNAKSSSVNSGLSGLRLPALCYNKLWYVVCPSPCDFFPKYSYYMWK